MGVREVLRVRTYILRSTTLPGPQRVSYFHCVLFLFGNVGVDGSQPPAFPRDGGTDDISC